MVSYISFEQFYIMIYTIFSGTNTSAFVSWFASQIQLESKICCGFIDKILSW